MFGAVPFVFGALRAQALPGPVLVEGLLTLGMSHDAARAKVSRLRRAHQLEAERRGRVSVYRLSGSLSRQFDRVRDAADVLTWDGGFHAVMYDIPESERRLRDRLRATAAEWDWGCPRRGVLIGMRPAEPWIVPYRDHPAVTIYPGRWESPLSVARQIAWQAWDLDNLQHDLCGVIARLEEVVPRESLAEGDTGPLRSYYDVHTQSVRALVRQPDLPTLLLPDDWPVGRLHSLLAQLREQHLPRAAAELEQRLELVDTAGIELLPGARLRVAG